MVEPIQLPSEDESRAIYRQRKEAVVAFVGGLNGVGQALSECVQALEDQLAKNSLNSGKSSSSDEAKKKQKSQRQKSVKQSGSGGQATLEAEPAQRCESDLSPAQDETGGRRKPYGGSMWHGCVETNFVRFVLSTVYS